MPIMTMLAGWTVNSVLKKIGLPLLLVVALGIGIVVAKNKWENFKEDLYNSGVTAGYSQAETEFSARVKAADDQNRAVESAIEDATNRFVAIAQENNDKRQRRETGYRDQVIAGTADIDQSVSCDLPQSVIDSRNAIRALGPEVKQEVSQ